MHIRTQCPHSVYSILLSKTNLYRIFKCLCLYSIHIVYCLHLSSRIGDHIMEYQISIKVTSHIHTQWSPVSIPTRIGSFVCGHKLVIVCDVTHGNGHTKKLFTKWEKLETIKHTHFLLPPANKWSREAGELEISLYCDISGEIFWSSQSPAPACSCSRELQRSRVMISAAAVWEEESPGWEMRNCTINIAAAGKQESIVHNYHHNH